MTTDTSDIVQNIPLGEEEYAPGAGVEHEHPSNARYVMVFVTLVILTAIEVALFYIPGIPQPLFVAALFVCAATKFTIVVMFFMHLKFDSPVFTTFFVGGLLMTVGAFVAVLAMFRAF